MSAIAASPPIFQPSNFLAEIGPLVSLRVNDPVWAIGSVRDLLSLCSQLSCLLEKEAKVGKRPLTEQLKANLLEKISRIVQRADSHSSLDKCLEDFHLGPWFPNVISDLSGQPRTYSDGPIAFKDYIAFMALINQVMVMSSQLRDDMTLVNHKYIAHQIALLYQCLNGIRNGVDKYKKRIETRFEEIKAITEQSTCPQLLDTQRTWLVELCSEITNTVNQFPSAMVKKVEPNLIFLKEVDTNKRRI
mmetsp:Transcript_174/g.339  ORF Transcript_174/g.339 Transcript_174/m.339 type:complete len:246 (-) Transcript_174:499-1236(-)